MGRPAGVTAPPPRKMTAAERKAKENEIATFETRLEGLKKEHGLPEGYTPVHEEGDFATGIDRAFSTWDQGIKRGRSQLAFDDKLKAEPVSLDNVDIRKSRQADVAVVAGGRTRAAQRSGGRSQLVRR